jgi:hypothetical protein
MTAGKINGSTKCSLDDTRRGTLLLVDSRPVKYSSMISEDSSTRKGGTTTEEDRYYGQTEYRRRTDYYEESRSQNTGQRR